MLNDILNIANKYASGVALVQARRDEWLRKHKELNEHLKEIADHLNTSAAYKQGFFVDVLHAWNEDINGSCADMPSITFRSGDMPMLVTFHNSMGERKEYMERGFQITFSPTITGQVIAMLLPHANDLSNTPPEYVTLAVIDHLDRFTMDVADEIISKGMEGAFYSSFTGSGENEQTSETQAQQVQQHAPIGFTRYETTEKVK